MAEGRMCVVTMLKKKDKAETFEGTGYAGGGRAWLLLANGKMFCSR